MILREKEVHGFFGTIGVPKKIPNFRKVLKKHHTGELHKKGTILGAANHTFFDSLCINRGSLEITLWKASVFS